MLREIVPAPERPDPGLRVELQRRQPAGARLGDALPATASSRRCAASGGRRVPQARRSASCSLNFTWWVNRKDRIGKNVFEGGFLGLDNIGVFDRSAPLPTGGHLEQADGTAWMALFCQNMLEIAVELAADDPTLRGHGDEVRRALPLDRAGDEPHRAATACGTRRTASSTTCCACPTAARTRLKVRSMVGPAAALRGDGDRAVAARARAAASSAHAREAPASACPSCCRASTRPAPGTRASPSRGILALVNEERLRRILARMLDEKRVPEPVRHPLALALPPRASVRLQRRRRRSTASATCRPSPTPACSAATRTGAARSGCR